MAKFREFAAGTRVRLSAKHIRQTGSRDGGKVWTVLAVSPRNGWLTIDEEFAGWESYFTAAELEKDPSLKWRRIAQEAVTIVGQLDSRDTP